MPAFEVFPTGPVEALVTQGQSHLHVHRHTGTGVSA